MCISYLEDHETFLKVVNLQFDGDEIKLYACSRKIYYADRKLRYYDSQSSAGIDKEVLLPDRRDQRKELAKRPRRSVLVQWLSRLALSVEAKYGCPNVST